jgi:pantetheine-phosphate adenylyltransferase
MNSMAHTWAAALRQHRRRPRALYADRFDPITAGHLAVIEQVVPLFREVTVVVTGRPDDDALFDLAERALLAQEVTATWPNVRVDVTAEPALAYARACGARYLLWGVRDEADAQRLADQARLDYLSAPEITPIFVPVPRRLAVVGSAELKDLARRGAALSRYCHPAVARRLVGRLGQTV